MANFSQSFHRKQRGATKSVEEEKEAGGSSIKPDLPLMAVTAGRVHTHCLFAHFFPLKERKNKIQHKTIGNNG